MPAPNYAQAHCEACDSRGRAVDLGPCLSCGHCGVCCRCQSPVPRRRATQDRWYGAPSALYPRYLGVEIECGVAARRGGYVHAALEAWDASAVGDGSVGHTPAGAPTGLTGVCEVVTQPARGEAFEAQIRDLCAGLARQAARVDKTCGLHVHVDARKVEVPRGDGTGTVSRPVSYADLCRLAMLFAKVESGLYNLVAASRRKNRRYCAPWGSTFDRAGVFLAETLPEKQRTLDCAIYGSEAAAATAKGAGKYHGSRYRSLNLHAFHCHGTVEFRLHHGTVDADKILMWAAVCSAIVQYAFTKSDDEVAALRGTPSEILDRIIPSPAVRAWCVKRREFFAARRSRVHPGEPPRRRAPGLPPPPVPAVEVGPEEVGE